MWIQIKANSWLTTASHTCLFREPNTTPRFTRMMAASFPQPQARKFVTYGSRGGTTASCIEDRTSFLARSAALRRGEEEQGHSLGIGLVMICDIGDKAGRAIMRVGKSSNSAFRVSRPTVDRDAPFVASRARVVLDQLWSRPRMAGTQ